MTSIPCGGLLPSSDGFAFTNAWPSGPAVELPTPFGQINIGNLPDADTGFDVADHHVVTDRGLAWRTIQNQRPQIAAGLDQGTA